MQVGRAYQIDIEKPGVRASLLTAGFLLRLREIYRRSCFIERTNRPLTSRQTKADIRKADGSGTGIVAVKMPLVPFVNFRPKTSLPVLLRPFIKSSLWPPLKRMLKSAIVRITPPPMSNWSPSRAILIGPRIGSNR
jgi:hypothetical protein